MYKSAYHIFTFLIVLVGIELTAFAQNTEVQWATHTHVGWGNQIPKTAKDSDGNIYLFGLFKDSLTVYIDKTPSTFVAQADYQPYFQKINKKGKTEKFQLLDASYRFVPSSFSINEQDELSILSVAGARYDSLIYYHHSLSENGTIQWRKPIFKWFGHYPHVILRNTLAGSEGNTFYTFQFKDTLDFFKGQKIMTARGDDHVLINVDNNGELKWFNQIKSLYGGTYVNALERDENGNVYLAGDYNSSIIIDGDTTSNPDIMGKNGFLVRYNSSGTKIDQFHIKSSNSMEINAISTANNGDIYLTGSFYGKLSLVVSGDSIPNQNYSSAFLLKTNSSFEPEWIHCIGKNQSAQGLQIHINPDNSITWIGKHDYEMDIDPSDEVKLRKKGIFIHQYSSNGVYRWSTGMRIDPTRNTTNIAIEDNDIFYIQRELQEKEFETHYRYKLELTKTKLEMDDQSKTVTISTCSPYFWKATGQTYDQSGTYYSKNKRDSLQLKIIHTDNTVRQDGLYLYAVEKYADYKWYNVTEDWKEVGTSYYYVVNETGVYALVVSSSICDKIDTSNHIFKEVADIPEEILSYHYNARDILFPKIGREHIQLKPEDVTMIPFRRDKYFGFVDKSNPENWLIQPTFEEVFAVYEEGAIVRDTNFHRLVGGYGLVNREGNYLIPPYYPNLFKEKTVYHGLLESVRDTALHLPEKYAEFNLHRYYNGNGDLLFTENSHDHDSFQHEELAWFRFGTTYHIRNLEGELVKVFEWSEDKSFIGIANNLLIFNVNGQIEAYTIDNELIFKLPINTYSKVYKFSPNLYGSMSIHTNDYFFVDSLGQEKPYDNTSNSIGFFLADEAFFHQEQFVVRDRENRAGGIINRQGETILDFKYMYIGPLSEGVRICEDTLYQWTVVDSTGNTIYNYDPRLGVYPLTGQQKKSLMLDGLRFSEGWSVGVKNKLYEENNAEIVDFNSIDDSAYFYFYNIKGEIMLELPCSIKLVGYFSDGLAPAINQDGGLGFINKEGEWVVPPNYELMFAGGYPFPYPVIPKFYNGFAYIKSFKGYVDDTGRAYFSGEQLKDYYNFSH